LALPVGFFYNQTVYCDVI